MKNKSLKIGIIASLVPHLFCCGLPIILSVVGLVTPRAMHWHIIPHEWEIWLFLFSAVMLCISWFLVLRDCHCKCDDCHTTPNHIGQKIFLGIATAAFVISITVHFLMH